MWVSVGMMAVGGINRYTRLRDVARPQACRSAPGGFASSGLRPGHVIRQARDGPGLPDRHRGVPAARARRVRRDAGAGTPAAETRRPGAQGAAADLAGARERKFVRELDDPRPAIGVHVEVSRFIGET